MCKWIGKGGTLIPDWFAASSRRTSCRCYRPCVGLRKWILALLFCGCFRIGEASNPGPRDQFDAEFTIGTFNPSGLRDKAQYFQSHMSDGDIWTVAETHFFGRDVSRFRAGLQASKSLHKYFLTDHCSLKKSLTSDTVWRGVGVLAKHPTRALPSGLPFDIQNSGRTLLFTTLLGDVWLNGAVLYGEPNGHHYPCWQRNNEYMLHHLAAHVCNLSCALDLGSWQGIGILTRVHFRHLVSLSRQAFEICKMLPWKGGAFPYNQRARVVPAKIFCTYLLNFRGCCSM